MPMLTKGTLVRLRDEAHDYVVTGIEGLGGGLTHVTLELAAAEDAPGGRAESAPL
jgi:hypothetical protein